MFAKSLRCVLRLAVVLMAGAALADEDILIDNFERWGDDAGWTIKGGAFLDEPSKEGGTGVTGHQREKFIYSASNGGDDSKGTLTSPLLEIERDHINFLILYVVLQRLFYQIVQTLKVRNPTLYKHYKLMVFK